jgi:hypothetical protein
MSRKLLQQALDAMERYQVKSGDFDRFTDEIVALRQELAKPEQEQLAKDQAIYGFSMTIGGKRIDPDSILNDPDKPLDEIPTHPKRKPDATFIDEGSKQEPVAQIRVKNGYWIDTPRSAKVKSLPDGLHNLYTAPPKREWVGLTDDERIKIIDEIRIYSGDYEELTAKAIEDKLKEKNGAT